MLLPAISWLFIQFAMTGVMVGSSANGMQVEICSPFGIQQITIDPETGEPTEPALGNEGCDWCQSFGLVVDTAERGDVDWQLLAQSHQKLLPLAPSRHTPLRLTADYNSRAPPAL